MGAFTGATVIKLLEDEIQVWLPRFIGTGNYELPVLGAIVVLLLKACTQPDGPVAYLEPWLPKVLAIGQRKRDWEAAAGLPQRDKPQQGQTLLEVVEVRKVFGGLVAVNDVSFDIKAGEIVGLLGPNGAGKSTTFNLITGVAELSSGRVRLLGEEIGGLPSRLIARRGVSRTFQHVKMLPEMSVLENVALGGYLRNHAGILRSVARARCRGRAPPLPRGRAPAGARGPARADARARRQPGPRSGAADGDCPRPCADPVLLLLDEPAAGLRHQEKQSLGRVLRQLKGEGMSLLLVEHDMEFVMDLTDRIVVMEFGTKLMEGTPAEVQASPQVRALPGHGALMSPSPILASLNAREPFWSVPGDGDACGIEPQAHRPTGRLGRPGARPNTHSSDVDAETAHDQTTTPTTRCSMSATCTPAMAAPRCSAASTCSCSPARC